MQQFGARPDYSTIAFHNEWHELTYGFPQLKDAAYSAFVIRMPFASKDQIATRKSIDPRYPILSIKQYHGPLLLK